MALQILVHGQPLDPHQAANGFLPLDVFFVCPACGSSHVLAKPPQTIENLGVQFGASQYQVWIPRKQDRWCVDCQHRWTAILAPEVLAR